MAAVKMTEETYEQGTDTYPRRKLVFFCSHETLFCMSMNLETGLDVCRATLDSRQM